MILIADSGSTKTDWCVVDGGNVICRVSTQGINPFHQDGRTISGILRDELLTADDCVRNSTGISQVYFYGSGCREEYVPMMTAALAGAFPHATRVEAYSDLLGAARAVCGAGEGVACILGTGANSCLYDGRHIVMNTPPLGYILGDEGSGAVLGRLFVNAMYKGSLPAAVLSDFERETGLTMADVIRRVYREPLANRFLASFAPFIHRHLSMPAVRTIVVDNFRQFFRRNVVQYGRPDLPVGAVGSIACHFSAELSEAARAEGFTMGRVIKSPMDGLWEYHARE
ncbi:MAG: ATPase [Prevotella sp.]|nr:ATPase [Prevotella sp.]